MLTIMLFQGWALVYRKFEVEIGSHDETLITSERLLMQNLSSPHNHSQVSGTCPSDVVGPNTLESLTLR